MSTEVEQMAAYNLCGQFVVSRPPNYKALPIKISFGINGNGIFTVSAVETTTGRYGNITITHNYDGPSNEEIKRMTNEAGKYKSED